MLLLGAALVLIFGGSWVAPSRAQAYWHSGSEADCGDLFPCKTWIHVSTETGARLTTKIIIKAAEYYSNRNYHTSSGDVEYHSGNGSLDGTDPEAESDFAQAHPEQYEDLEAERLVLQGDSLTKPAETIITNPTFLEEEPAIAGDTALADELAGAGALPEAAELLPWVAGATAAVIGAAVVCETIFGSCLEIFPWEDDGSGGTTTGPNKIVWEYAKHHVSGAGPAGASVNAGYYYTVLPEVFGPDLEAECESSFGFPDYPPGATAVSIPWPHFCLSEEKDVPHKTFLRSGNLNRGMKASAGPESGGLPSSYLNPATGELQGKPVTGWQENLACELHGECGYSQEKGQRITNEVAGEIGGADLPYPGKVKVPTCVGLKMSACVALVEELELEPKVTELDWDDAVIEELDKLDPEKTREEESERVIELVPPPGHNVDTESEITIVVNPVIEDMPEFVPEADDNETYDEYRERKLGLPLWLIHAQELNDGTLDPGKGPHGVVRTHPGAGTRVDPHAGPESQDLEVQYNPVDAPPAVGAWSPPAIPPLDLTPLQGVSIGCNRFPFGVFCWMAAGLADWGSEGECPSFGVPFVSEIRNSEDALVFNTCAFEPAMNIIRPVLVILSFFGVAWLLASSAMGLGGGASADD